MGAPRVTGIVLDRERVLLYRFEDLVPLERQLGTGMEAALQSRSVTGLLAFLWAGLRHQDMKLAPSDVIKVVDGALKQGKVTYAELWNTVSEALVNSGILGSPDEDEQKAADPDAPGPS